MARLGAPGESQCGLIGARRDNERRGAGRRRVLRTGPVQSASAGQSVAAPRPTLDGGPCDVSQPRAAQRAAQSRQRIC